MKRTCEKLSVEQYLVTSVEEVRRTDVSGEAGLGSYKNKVLRLETELKLGVLSTKGDDFYVPMDQALGNLVAAALEPEPQTSFPASFFLSKNVTQGETLAIYRVTQQPARQFVYLVTTSEFGLRCDNVSSIISGATTIFTRDLLLSSSLLLFQVFFT